MLDLLELSVDRRSEVPLGTQLVWKLRTLIATGDLAPGARLPGIREVAEAAGVNVNTVRGVFARLEEQGLLASEHGRGTFVAQGAPSDATLAEVAKAAMAWARESGVDPRELAAALYVNPGARSGEGPVPAPAVVPTPAPDPAAVPDEREERRALRTQIAQLERELAQIDRLGTLEEPTHTPDPRILTAADLREIRDNVADRIRQLHREREEVEPDPAEGEAADAGPARERAARWRHAGVWTGRPATEVSWTTP